MENTLSQLKSDYDKKDGFIRSKITPEERKLLRKIWNAKQGVDWDYFLYSCAENASLKIDYLTKK